jgi:hypothetical protein
LAFVTGWVCFLLIRSAARPSQSLLGGTLAPGFGLGHFIKQIFGFVDFTGCN